MDLFVASADTEAGKTVVTAALALALQPDVAVIKPVQTGCPPDDDAAVVAAITGAKPYVWERFGPPLGPATAAAIEGRRICVEDLAARTCAVSAGSRLCEQAGGFLSPLNDDSTMADLAVRLGWPVVLAARPTLGTLGVTALVIEAVRRRNLDLVGIVVSGYVGGFLEDDNLARLDRIAPVLAVIPQLADLAAQLGSSVDWQRPELLDASSAATSVG